MTDHRDTKTRTWIAQERDEAVQQYKAKLRERVEKAEMEIDEELKRYASAPDNSAFLGIRQGRKNSMTWFLTIINEIEP